MHPIAQVHCCLLQVARLHLPTANPACAKTVKLTIWNPSRSHRYLLSNEDASLGVNTTLCPVCTPGVWVFHCPMHWKEVACKFSLLKTWSQCSHDFRVIKNGLKHNKIALLSINTVISKGGLP